MYLTVRETSFLSWPSSGNILWFCEFYLSVDILGYVMWSSPPKLTEHLLCSWHCSECLTHTLTALWGGYPHFQIRNMGTERLGNWTRLTQLVCDRARIWTQFDSWTHTFLQKDRDLPTYLGWPWPPGLQWSSHFKLWASSWDYRNVLTRPANFLIFIFSIARVLLCCPSPSGTSDF